MRPAASIPRRMTGPAWRTLLAVAVLVAVNAAVYSRSLTVPFIFDDLTSIPENPNIQTLWPPWKARTAAAATHDPDPAVAEAARAAVRRTRPSPPGP